MKLTKFKFKTAFLITAMAGILTLHSNISYGAATSVATFDGGNFSYTTVVDTSNATIPRDTGFTALGGFSGGISDAQIAIAAAAGNLAASFVNYASNTFGNINDGNGNLIGNGVTNYVSNNSIRNGTDDGGNTVNLETENAYLVFGNGLTLASSTQVGVYDLNRVFPLDDPGNPVPPAFDVRVLTFDPSLIIYGAAVSAVISDDLNGAGAPDPGSTINSLQLGRVIPEPSSSILLLLGVVGIVARRKR